MFAIDLLVWPQFKVVVVNIKLTVFIKLLGSTPAYNYNIVFPGLVPFIIQTFMNHQQVEKLKY